jgi:hypothetical protein
LACLALVIGAGTAFGVHRYFQSDPEQRRGLMDQILGRSDAAPPQPPSLATIQEATEELSRLTARRDLGTSGPRASALVDQLDRAYTALAEQLRGDEARLRELRILTLHAKYAAARVDRDRFAAPLLEYADELIARPDGGGEAGQAAVLQLVVRHDLRHPATRDVLEDLDGFAASHPQSLGAMAFCLAAQELAQNGHPKSAEAVLRHGINVYRATPAAGTLVNQLVDLGLSKAPRPGITQAGWQAVSRIYERAAQNARQDACAPKSKSRRR